MSEKTISVVMATYNGARFIQDQLISLEKQTVLPKEIIISDDGSDDGTQDIVAEFKRNCRIKVKILTHPDKLGFRENFLRAASEASGDFIAFCDQDDVWRQDKIESCVPHLDDPRVSMIVHPARTIDDRSQVIGVFPQGIEAASVRMPLHYDPWGAFWGFSIVFRRDLLDLYPASERFLDYIAPSHRIAHDRWITFLGQMVGATVELDACLVDYRQHRNNLFGQGLGGRINTTDDIRGRSAVYLSATAQMLDVVRNLRDETAGRFPLYDRERCIDYVERAQAQLRARDAVYATRTRLGAVRGIGAALVRGRYRGVNDGRMRWRSVVRDLRFAALRR